MEVETLRSDDFAAFALYSAPDEGEKGSDLRSLVFVDSTVWNPPSPRPSRVVDISAVAAAHSGRPVVKRFTSAGGVNATGTDWNVASVGVDDETGKLVGRVNGKALTYDSIKINAAEAVLIELR